MMFYILNWEVMEDTVIIYGTVGRSFNEGNGIYRDARDVSKVKKGWVKVLKQK